MDYFGILSKVIITLLWIKRAAVKFYLTDAGRYFNKVSLTVLSLEGKGINIIEKCISVEKLVHKVYATFAKFYFYYSKKFSLCIVIYIFLSQ